VRKALCILAVNRLLVKRFSRREPVEATVSRVSWLNDKPGVSK
jgi:hypothetical protein